MNPKIWLSSPHMGGNELKYIHDAFEHNWVAPLGPNVDEFEKDLQTFCSIDHAAALSSGTAALHLALIILGVQPGDEVICSSFTFSATANPIVYLGATPVFIDSEPTTWNMDPELLEQAIIDRIKQGKTPKAIVVVHLYGMGALINDIITIADKYEIPVIEDAAEALGSTVNGKALGTFGAMGILSFNGNKIITTSGGGALISHNKEWIEKARFLATQARDQAPHYQHSHIGYNYRMSNICAGIGRGQMEVLPNRISARRANKQWYKELLANLDYIKFQEEPQGFFSNYWLTSIIINPKNNKAITRETLRMALLEDNIESRPLWKPMHLQPVFEHCPAYLNGVSESLFTNGLCLPSGSNLSPNDFERIKNNLLQHFYN